ncbi:hypothetical protein V8G54_024197, partial [Vigna mungo]
GTFEKGEKLENQRSPPLRKSTSFQPATSVAGVPPSESRRPSAELSSLHPATQCWPSKTKPRRRPVLPSKPPCRRRSVDVRRQNLDVVVFSPPIHPMLLEVCPSV